MRNILVPGQIFISAIGGPMPGRKVSAEDHGAWVSIVTGVFMAYTIFCLLARLLMRFTINGPLMKDDAAVAAATIFATIQSALKLSESDSGLGKRLHSLSPSSAADIEKLEYASSIFYIVALAFSKTASFALFERLSSQRNHLIVTRVGYALTAAWAVASVIVIGVQCPGTVPWKQLVVDCPKMYDRWLGIEIVSILIEAYFFCLPIYLIWGLHISHRAKLIVLTAFSFRLLVIVTSALRIHYLRQWFSLPDATFHGAPSSACMEANLHYSIIAATIPCLKPFMRSLNSGYMSHRAPQSTIGSGVHSNSVPLTSISSQKGKGPMRSRRGPQSDGDGDSLVDVDDDNGYDSGTAGSDKMIIKYKKSWEVSYSIRNLECPS